MDTRVESATMREGVFCLQVHLADTTSSLATLLGEPALKRRFWYNLTVAKRQQHVSMSWIQQDQQKDVSKIP